MENRIKIGDVWYVKEDTTRASAPEEEFDFMPIQTRAVMIETEDLIMEGVVLEDDNGKFSMPSIDITYKGTDDKDFWDNDLFIVGIAKGQLEHLDEIRDQSREVQRAAVLIASRMLELGWVK